MRRIPRRTSSRLSTHSSRRSRGTDGARLVSPRFCQSSKLAGAFKPTPTVTSLTQQFSAAPYYPQKLEEQTKQAELELKDLQAQIDAERQRIAELEVRTAHFEDTQVKLCTQRGGQLRGRAGQCRAQRAIGPAQRAAQLTQRYRIHPPDRPGQQSLGGLVVESVLGGGQHSQQGAGAGLGAPALALYVNL